MTVEAPRLYAAAVVKEIIYQTHPTLLPYRLFLRTIFLRSLAPFPQTNKSNNQ
jgi:hypothetical protein